MIDIWFHSSPNAPYGEATVQFKDTADESLFIMLMSNGIEL